MVKYLFIAFCYFMALLPIFTTYIYTKIMFKRGCFSIGNNFYLYVLSMAIIFYLGFGFSESFIPIINEKLYNSPTRVMGWAGFLEDFIIPLLIIIPLFLIANLIFKVKFKRQIGREVYLFLYYVVNYVVWSLYFSLLAHNIY